MWPKSDNNFLRFNEKSNIYDSLEKLEFFLDQTQYDLNFWKWAIIALHNSLYGSMILCLTRTNPTSIIEIDKELEDKLNKIYKIDKLNINSTNHVPKICLHGKIISFLKSFKRIQQQKYMRMNTSSNIFNSAQRHIESTKFLNSELRNQFLHFSPMGWSISTLDFKNVFNDCLEIIKFCILRSGNVLLEEEERQLFETIIKSIKDHKKLVQLNI